MAKIYNVLGLMSGTSGDGLDTSLIRTDGLNIFEVVKDNYFEFPHKISDKYKNLKKKINHKEDLIKYYKELVEFEREITLFTAKVVNEIKLDNELIIDLVGFHGQTIYHNASERITKQLGNGNLLSQLTKLNIVYEFRINDIKHGGQGAPLAPIFHLLLHKKFNLKNSIFLNIGGILNATSIFEHKNLIATDLGPGMCLLDDWVRLNSGNKFDKDGSLSLNGKVHMNLNYELDNFFHFEEKKIDQLYMKSFDTNDFDHSFVRGLSLEDGAATLSEYTAKIITDYYLYILKVKKTNKVQPKLILCGGGRKNKKIVETIKNDLKKNQIHPLNEIVEMIDKYGFNGDFIESQAFGYLAVRSLLCLPISFPETTGCKQPITGGKIIKL